MRSWWDHEKEVAQPEYFREWDLELWQILVEYLPLNRAWVQVGEDTMYHLTGKSVERWKIPVLKARKGAKIKYDAVASRP
jgi:hypothetical protein